MDGILTVCYTDCSVARSDVDQSLRLEPLPCHFRTPGTDVAMTAVSSESIAASSASDRPSVTGWSHAATVTVSATQA